MKEEQATSPSDNKKYVLHVYFLAEPLSVVLADTENVTFYLRKPVI